MKSEKSELALGEMTLEDFLVQAGIFSEASISPTMELDSVDAVTPQSFSKQMVLSSSPSIGILSDTTTSRRKRHGPNAIEKNIERRLSRKIKNRESAARSRTRKLAYHNELASKVSHLEEQNIKLKKEKGFYQIQPCECEGSPEAKYQLRRTSSASL